MLRDPRYDMLWCELPRSRRKTLESKVVATKLQQLLAAADAAKIPAICVGPKQAQWQNISTSPWRKSTVHVRALETKFGTQPEPSSVVYNAVSNLKQAAGMKCTCPAGTKHVFDLPPFPG